MKKLPHDCMMDRRLSGRRGKENDPSDGRWEIFREQKKNFEPFGVGLRIFIFP